MDTSSLPTAAYWQPALGGLGAFVDGLDEIHQALLILLMTPKGTDPLRPEFGVGLQKWVDQPAQRIVGKAVAEISRALALWEPRIVPLSITLVETGDAGLTVKVRWRPADLPVGLTPSEAQSRLSLSRTGSTGVSASALPWIPFVQADLQVALVDGGTV